VEDPKGGQRFFDIKKFMLEYFTLHYFSQTDLCSEHVQKVPNLFYQLPNFMPVWQKNLGKGWQQRPPVVSRLLVGRKELFSARCDQLIYRTGISETYLPNKGKNSCTINEQCAILSVLMFFQTVQH
jgi:hypothetical protein